MQFTINRVIIKLFGPKSLSRRKPLFWHQICERINNRNRSEKFITSYSASDNCLCRLISTRCWIYCDFAIFAVFLGYRCFDGEIKSCINQIKSNQMMWLISAVRLQPGAKLVKGKGIKVKKRIAVCATSTAPLRELTCHMGSHRVTCHPAEVTFPPLPQPIKAGTRFSDLRGMQGPFRRTVE